MKLPPWFLPAAAIAAGYYFLSSPSKGTTRTAPARQEERHSRRPLVRGPGRRETAAIGGFAQGALGGAAAGATIGGPIGAALGGATGGALGILTAL